MKERGLIFSGPMVRANLEGRKTQTRRVIKLPDAPSHLTWQYDKDNWFRLQATAGGTATVFRYYKAKCPYGVVGDRFYMRETFTLGTGTGCPGFIPLIHVTYKADETLKIFKLDDVPKKCNMKFKTHPSIHMPKWAARPERFEITDIRVERVQDITHCAIYEEGVNTPSTPKEGYPDNLKNAFIHLWDSINAKRGYDWQINPWVWVISYRKL